MGRNVSVPDSSSSVLNWKILATGKKITEKIIFEIQAMILTFQEQHFTSCSN